MLYKLGSLEPFWSKPLQITVLPQNYSQLPPFQQFLAIIAASVVALLIIGLNFESMYNYLVWYIPLSKISHSQIVYVEKEEGSYNRMHMPTTKDVKYVNDNSIEITFAKTKFTDFIPNNFEFTRTVHEGDTFIAMCREVVNGIAKYSYFTTNKC